MAGGAGAGGQGGGGGCEADLGSDPENCGSCGHSCLGAECLAGSCGVVVLMDGTHESPIAMDETDLYWFDGPADALMRVSKMGGAAEVVVELSVSSHRSLVVANGYAFLSAYSGGNSLFQIDLATGTTTRTFDETAGGWQGRFAVDEEQSFVAQFFPQAKRHADSEFTSLVPNSAMASYAMNDMAVDDVYAYATGSGFSGQGPALFRIPKEGGVEGRLDGFAADEIVGVAGGLLSLHNGASCSSTSTIERLDHKAQSSTVATFVGIGHGLRADETHIYYVQECVNAFDGALYAQPRSGGAAQLVHADVRSDAYHEVAHVSDEEAVYFWAYDIGSLVRRTKPPVE